MEAEPLGIAAAIVAVCIGFAAGVAFAHRSFGAERHAWERRVDYLQRLLQD